MEVARRFKLLTLFPLIKECNTLPTPPKLSLLISQFALFYYSTCFTLLKE